MKSLLTAIVILVVLIVAAVVVIQNWGTWRPAGLQVKNTLPNTPVPTATPTAVPVVSENITVTSPKIADTIERSFTVKGEARVFENVVSLRVIGAQGESLYHSTAYAQSKDVGEFGPFSKQVSLPATVSGQITLEVYQASAKDGSPIDTVTIPLTIK